MEMPEKYKHYIKDFKKIAPKYKEVYGQLDLGFCKTYANNFWLAASGRIAQKFSQDLPIDFLETQELRETMFSQNENVAKIRYDSVIKAIHQLDKSELLTELLIDNPMGSPTVFVKPYCTYKSVQIAYLLSLYFRFVKRDIIPKQGSVVEFGGGYGAFAWSMFGQNDISTYTLIDVPALAALQYIYLSSAFGEGNVNLVEDKIVDGKINIMTTNKVAEIEPVKPDLFVALWSLGESNNKTLDAVTEAGYLDTSRILVTTGRKSEHFNVSSLLFNLLKDKCLNIQSEEVADHSYLMR